MKIKRFSGYSESNSSGITYQPGQVISKYLLEPVDVGIDFIDSTEIGKSGIIRKKRNRIKRVINPIKQFLNKNN